KVLKVGPVLDSVLRHRPDATAGPPRARFVYVSKSAARRPRREVFVDEPAGEPIVCRVNRAHAVRVNVLRKVPGLSLPKMERVGFGKLAIQGEHGRKALPVPAGPEER